MKSYRHDLLELKSLLENLIEDVHLQILEFPPNQQDEEFEFLIKKAISYRETLKKIKQELKEL